MTAKELKKRIFDCLSDICFDYSDDCACITPFNEKKYEVAWRDLVIMYHDIEDVMNDPIYDGKSLNEIAEELDIRYG